jgi:hypothetical protein
MGKQGADGGLPNSKKMKLSASEQSAKLHARALALENQGKMDELKMVLKQRPDLLDTTLNHCKKLAGIAVMGPPSTPKKTGQPGSRDGTPGPSSSTPATPSSSAAGSQLGDDAGDDEPGPAQSMNVPRCYTSIGMITPIYLTTFLAGVEPIALSKQNLGNLSSKKSRHICKDRLMELVEFLTGLGPDADYHPDFHVMSKWVELAAGYNVSRGRPAKELQLPVTWASDGMFKWYMPSGDGAMVMVVHNITKVEREVTKGFWDVVKNPQALYIDKNYSEKNATLCEKDGFGRLPITTIFPEIIENDLMRWCAKHAGTGETEVADEELPAAPTPLQNAAAEGEAPTPPPMPAANASEVYVTPPPPSA